MRPVVEKLCKDVEATLKELEQLSPRLPLWAKNTLNPYLAEIARLSQNIERGEKELEKAREYEKREIEEVQSMRLRSLHFQHKEMQKRLIALRLLYEAK